MEQRDLDFDAIKITLASPELIRRWSHGEVTSPDTINYRTLKPTKEGLFCERIFGPTKDWECQCGKYKRAEHQGVTCDKCGVKVDRSQIRRERMGHIELAAPVAHFWFAKSAPGRLALTLKMSSKDVDRMLGYSHRIVTAIDEDERALQIAARRTHLDRLIIALANLNAPETLLPLFHQTLMPALPELLNAAPDADDAIDALANQDIAAASAADCAKIAKALADIAESAIAPDYAKLAALLSDIAAVIAALAAAPNNYETKLIPLRSALYSSNHAAPPPSGAKSWQAAGRRHDRLLKDLAQNADKAQLALASAIAELEPFQTPEMFNAASAFAPIATDIINTIAEMQSIESLKLGLALTESDYRDIEMAASGAFECQMGADAALTLLRQSDMAALHNHADCAERERACRMECERADDARYCIRHCRLRRDVCEMPCHEREGFCDSKYCVEDEIAATTSARQAKAYKRLRLIKAFMQSGNKPEWMILTALPVLPPELRPMIQLGGGNFATSDLNDLYIKVINRNNRLKKLAELNTPETILRNEKRMLQQAVNALVDNSRTANPVAGRNGNKLKSLSDLLRGKQGRFRQNLLGKRVDYSGRSVIVVGPELKFNQCGLPRKMALELFKPFVMNVIMQRGLAINPKGAKRVADSESDEVWEILEQVIQDRPILINRAPTLHRLGIQAFQPVLIEGNAIRIHPLVTPSFNADFDGDQMAVHLPLGPDAKNEAKAMMLSYNNMIAPSSGEAIVAPTLDIILGCYYLTQAMTTARGAGESYSDIDDALLAYDLDKIDLRAPVHVRNPNDGEPRRMQTTPGRIIFNEALPPELRFINEVIDKGALKKLTAKARSTLGGKAAAAALDNIKDLGFGYAALSGITIAIQDVEVPPEKPEVLKRAQADVNAINEMFADGMVTNEERYANSNMIWNAAGDELTGKVEANMKAYGGATKEARADNAGVGLYIMAVSGAKGNISQIKQMAAMRGLMADPKGRVIERPIKASFREGLSVQEYFISTHGARKGLTDTALKTADSGYMTRRLVDVAQDMVALIDDCQTENGIWIDIADRDGLPSFEDRISSRYLAADVINKSGEPLARRNEPVSLELAAQLAAANIPGAKARSALACAAERGLCRKCYGLSLATWQPILIGEAIGVLAAQSIGEPGTQLTMRTFHTGGVAGSDITSGLPRVQELFEAQSPKGEAVLSEISGETTLSETYDGRIVTVGRTDTYAEEHAIDASAYRLADGIAIGQRIESADPIAHPIDPAAPELLSRVSGMIADVIHNADSIIVIVLYEEEERREYAIPAAARIIVENGDRVEQGEPLTAGPKNPKDVLALEGIDAAQQYLIDEVQAVYLSQGVPIHDKHIEVIVSQMLKRVQATEPGASDLLPGDLIDAKRAERLRREMIESGLTPPEVSPVMLSITDAALKTDSFLSAASFQETTRVLADAAVGGDVDPLRGLKENVIIGRLIPARLDLSEDGRALLQAAAEENTDITPADSLSPAAD